MEIIVGVALTLLILGVLHAFQRWQFAAFARQAVYVESQNVTRNAMETMARELRMATFDPTGAALPATGLCCPGFRQGLVEASPGRIRFQQDLNGDGDVADGGEDVAYELAGDVLSRVDGGVAASLATSIPADGLTFRYFDGSNPPVEFVPAGTPATLNQCQRDCVAKVGIAIRAEFDSPHPQLALPVRAQAATEVAIRNRSLDNF